MQYTFKGVPETVRAVALAVVVYIAIALTGAASVSDWHAYMVPFLTGLASAVGTAILGALTPSPESGSDGSAE